VTAAVLEGAKLRVDIGGAPAIDGLSFETTGERLMVLASPPALFQAAAGQVAPKQGTLRVGGLAPAIAVAERQLAAAPLDPPLPPAFSARQYVTWSARLAGYDRRDAEGQASSALESLKLTSIAGVRLRPLAPEARRAVVVAAALATGATTLLLEDPLTGLREDVARTFGRTLVRATASLRLVVFAARTSLSSPLATDADEALVFDRGHVVAQGAPAEVASRDRSFAVKLHGPSTAFARLAEQRGARVAGHGSDWTVDLGPALQTSDLFDVAGASGTVVLELRPLGYAFV
jgi:ABC-2 type transport system ATP-binding protein